MKYGYREIRKIDADKIRALCIAKQWFTEGTNREYDALLFYGLSHQTITTDELVEMAELILEHSNTEYDITSVMFELNANCCYTYFEEV